MFGVDHCGQHPVHGGGIFARVRAVRPLNLIGHVFGHPQVPVVTPELHVAVGGDGADLAGGELQQRGIEGPAPQVVDKQRHLVLGRGVGREIAERLAEGQRGCRRLVDNVEQLKAGQFGGVGRGLAARLVEIGRHGNDHVLALAQGVQGVELQLSQDARLDDLGRHLLPADGPHVVGLAHVPFHPFGDPLGMHRGGGAGFFADGRLLVGKQHHAGRQQVPLGVADHRRPARFIHPRHRRKGGAEIDSNGAFAWHGKNSWAEEPGTKQRTATHNSRIFQSTWNGPTPQDASALLR